MKIEVDQSGKVEDTSHKTVVALCNSTKYSVVISSKEKRRLQEKFRKIGKPKLFVNITFAVLVSLVIKKSVGLRKRVVVDIEYQGHTKVIENIINSGEEVTDIIWTKIGKGSSAHDLAYKVFVGKKTANLVVNADYIWKEAKKKTGGYLNSGLEPENRHSAPVSKCNLTKKRFKVKK